jgi:hypothetical protein
LTFHEAFATIFQWYEWQEQWRQDFLTMLPSEETDVSRQFFNEEDYQAYLELMSPELHKLSQFGDRRVGFS